MLKMGVIDLDKSMEPRIFDSPVKPLSAEFSLNGSLVYVAGRHRDGPNAGLCIYNTSDWSLESSALLPTTDARHIKLTPDGTRLVVADHGRVQMLELSQRDEPDFKSWKPIQTSEASFALSERLRFSPDGSQLLVARRGGTADLYDAVTLTRLKTLWGLERNAVGACFDSTGRFVYLSGSPPGVLRFDLQRPESFYKTKLHPATIQSLAVSPDNLRVASVNDAPNPSVLISSLKDLRVLQSLDAKHRRRDDHFDSLVEVAWIDRTTLLTASYFQTIFIWNVETGDLKDVIELDAQPGLLDICMSSDRTHVATCGIDGVARVVNLADHRVVRQYTTTSSLRGVQLDADGDYLYAAGTWGGQGLYQWCLSDAEDDRSIQQPLALPIRHMAMVGEADGLILGALHGLVAKVAFSGEPREMSLLSDLAPTDDPDDNTAVIVNNDATRCITADASGRVLCRDIQTLTPTLFLHGHQAGVSAACFSPDGRILLTGDSDGYVCRWDGS